MRRDPIHRRNGLAPETRRVIQRTETLLPSAQQHELEGACALKAAACEVIAGHSARVFGEGLRSIVLTGSLARDEATLAREGDQWTVLGDAEFLLIFHEAAPLPSGASLNALRKEIGRALLERGIVCLVSLSASHSDYLIEIRPHIFAYELRTCGQVIWGEREILSLIPAFSPSDIPLEDGWRMLLNRMVELLEAMGERTTNPGTVSPDVQYRAVKLYLDMATSFLLFHGAYEPTYRRREERLRSLAADLTRQGNPPFFPLRAFSELVTACTEYKLSTTGPTGRGANIRWICRNPAFWKELVAHARALWRWELERLTGEQGQLPHRQLMKKWMRLQPAGKRLRGWAYVLRGCGWHRSWREWPHWLRRGWQASPRCWVYAAASELFFKLDDFLASAQEARCADGEMRELWSWLPLVRKHELPPDLPAWQSLACEIGWNYHQFLESTQA